MDWRPDHELTEQERAASGGFAEERGATMNTVTEQQERTSGLAENWQRLERQTRQEPEYSTGDFTYEAASKVFATEVSSLATAPGNGFWLRSQRTGKRVWFVLDGSERDDEGDLQFVRYRPANESNLTPALAGMAGVRVVVFND